MAETALSKRPTPRWRIKIEPRLDEPPAWYPAAVSLLAIVVALILGGIVIAFAGGNPIAS